MKIFFILLLASSFAQAADKKLVCQGQYEKYGMTSANTELYVASSETPDSEVIAHGHEHGRAWMDFNATSGLFSGGAEEGCVAVDYNMIERAEGIFLIIDEEYDNVASHQELKCIEVK